ncbi:antibiotic biosynthesis monooxygenase [Streptomyces sp. PTD9-10]|uniref:antibiotic biosynthesis monooxygenase n=1 Tax=Streptomyces sp. PTD9-10 TaxID=3120151 RepID=UPI00300AED0A
MSHPTGGQAVSIARFTLKTEFAAKGAEFEALFPTYVAAAKAAEGTLRTGLASSTTSSGRYLQLTWWRDSEARQAMMSDPALFRNVGIKYFTMARHDKVNGDSIAGGLPDVPYAVVALTDLPATEENPVQALHGLDGFLADQLVQPDEEDGRYLLTWWRDEDAFHAALATAPAALDGAESFAFLADEVSG